MFKIKAISKNSLHLFIYFGRRGPTLQKPGNYELIVLRYNISWTNGTMVIGDTRTASGLQQTLQFSKPHQPPHTGLWGLQYWLLLDLVYVCEQVCVCPSFCLQGCTGSLCRARLSLRLPTHLSTVHPKSRGSNSLLWLTQIEHINNTINPPFRPLTPYS